MIGGYKELGSSGNFASNKGGKNLLIDVIIGGYTGDGTSTRAEVINTVTNTWHGEQYLELKNDAWERLQDYYNDLNK